MAKPSSQEVDASLKAARELALSLQVGQPLPSVAIPVNLIPGEICVGHTGVRTFQWLEGDSTYIHKSGGYFGFGGMAVFGTANIIGNAWRRASAGRAAAPQWRALDQGHLFVTDRRLAIQGEVRWTEIPLDDLRMIGCERDSLVIEIVGTARVKIEIARPDYWYVMLRKLVFDEVFVPPEDILKGAVPSERMLNPLADAEVPDILVGLWVGLRDGNRSLSVAANATFLLSLNSTEFTGVARTTGTHLTLDSPGLAGAYDWTIERDKLILRRDSSVSEYRRAPSAIPDDLIGTWVTLGDHAKVLFITAENTFSFQTEDSEVNGQIWTDGRQATLQTSDRAASLCTWDATATSLTLTRRDGTVSQYLRQA